MRKQPPMMTQSGGSWCWKLGLVSCLAMGGAAYFGDCALAQITPDGTLPNNSIVTPQGNTSLISGGTQAGSNLFHSFEEFSVPIDGTAYFNNAPNIQNIISRVTGESISKIDGLLKANASTNLFLLNPNGIIFGPNASLNIGGSFVASTASSLNFADGTQFSATAHLTTPLLQVSVPIGLQFGGNPGRIVVQGAGQSQNFLDNGTVGFDSSVGLQVQPGLSLALVGGNVHLDGGILQAPGGRVELGGLSRAGTVGLNRDGSLSFPAQVQRRDVSFTNGAAINVAAGGGGSIVVNAQNLNFSGGSFLRAGIAPLRGLVSSRAGDITLNATGEIKAISSDIFNLVQQGAVGKAGDINITTGSLSLTNGATLIANTFGQGDAGSVTINARNTVSFDGERRARIPSGLSNLPSGVYSLLVGEKAEGKGGDVNITTESISLTNGAVLNASTLGVGDAGSVNINAGDTVFFDGSGVYSTVEQGAVGKGGNVKITTRSLSLSNGAQLNASTSAKGVAGSVNINAGDTVSFDGSWVFNTVNEGARGKAGGVKITTRSLSLTNSAQLNVSTSGQGDAGNVNIDARDTVFFDGSGVYSTVDTRGIGKGGNVNITTGSLSFTTNAGVFTSTKGQGDAGSVNIDAGNTVSFDESGVYSTVEQGAVGKGGNVNITTASLSLSNGAQLNASTNGRGDAGSVNIDAGDTVSFEGSGSGVFNTVNPGAIGKGGDVNISKAYSTVQPEAMGNGGDIIIKIEAGSLSLTNGALLSASSAGNGTAGNIDIDASSIRLENFAGLSSDTIAGQGNIILHSQDLVLRHGSNITTDAKGTATGGNINIDTGVIAALENSDIRANAEEAFGGRVIIDAQGIFGTEFRERTTSESDITATSRLGPQFSGTVEINTPDVDPSLGLVYLLVELVDASGLIASGCAAGGENEFIITGRGGLPPNPSDTLSSDTVWSDLRTFTKPARTPSSSEEAINPTRERAPTQIVEATGWMINDKGEVVLTASAPTVTPYIPWLPSCVLRHQ